MSFEPRVLENGDLSVRVRLVIPREEIDLRVTTSGGPGGQHANRSLTRVVVSFDVAKSQVLSDADRELLLDKLGDVVRSSSSRYRSQRQNRDAALQQLAAKLSSGLDQLLLVGRVDPRSFQGSTSRPEESPGTDQRTPPPSAGRVVASTRRGGDQSPSGLVHDLVSRGIGLLVRSSKRC